MKRTLLAGVAALFMTACATTETAPATTGVAVSEPPCNPSKAPRSRSLPADALTGNEDIFTWGTTMWADYLARRAYQRELEAFVEECTKPTP